LRVGDVGHVHLAVDVEMVDLRLEGAADLADVAAEFDARATRVNGDVCEAARSKPVGDGCNVGIGGAKLRSELLRREPLVIIRRSLVLLLLEELREGRLLIVAALEKKRDARGGLRVGYGAAIEFGASEAMDVAAKRDAIGVVNRLRDARGDSRRLRKLCGVALHAR